MKKRAESMDEEHLNPAPCLGRAITMWDFRGPPLKPGSSPSSFEGNRLLWEALERHRTDFWPKS
jgi:hypothetical protein